MLNIKWQYKLFILAAFLGIVPALFISMRLISITETELTSKINNELISATDNLSDYLNSFFTESYQKQLLIKNTVENENLGPDEKISVMIASIEEIEEFISIGLFFENSTSSFDMAIQVNTEELDDLIEVNQIEKGLIYGSIPKDYEFESGRQYDLRPIRYIKEIDYWIVHYILPVYLPDAPKAYMLTTIKLNGLRERLLSDRFNNFGSLYIMNQAGKFMLTDSTELTHSNFIIQDAIEMLHGNSRVTGVTNYSEGDNKIVVSFAYPANLNWVVIAELKEEDAYAAVSDMRNVLFIWLIVGLTLALLAVILFTRILRKPISQLEEKATEISNGNFDIEVDYKLNDSIGTLGNTLVGMSKSLKQSFSKIEEQNKQLEDYSKSLEAKVAERTKELKETNENLQKAYLQVLELNEEKNEFLGIAAHDLKNPLGTIKGYGDIILDEKDIARDEIENFVGQIVDSSKRMFSIITSLLDVNKLEEGQIKINISDVQIGRVLDEVIHQNSENASRKKINLNVAVPEKVISFQSDNVILSQIIDNILSNAIKFSQPEKEIFIIMEELDNKIVIRIKDQGPGFTEKDKKKLFGKFVKLSARPTGGEHSTGLGLSIAKKLVEILGGSITVDSEEGNGAEFILEFNI